MNPNFAVIVFVVIVVGSIGLYYITPNDSADHFEISKMIFKTSHVDCAKIFDDVFFSYFNHMSQTNSVILEYNSYDMPGDILVEWEGATQFRDSTCYEDPHEWMGLSNYPHLIEDFDWDKIRERI